MFINNVLISAINTNNIHIAYIVILNNILLITAVTFIVVYIYNNSKYKIENITLHYTAILHLTTKLHYTATLRMTITLHLKINKGQL